MSKLSSGEKFLDLSDYGRPVATSVVKRISDTGITPVQITLIFGFCGLSAVFFILNGFYITAGIFLVLKSIIDAMDGELARVRKTPSFTGRYLDSVFDIILNAMFVLAVWSVTGQSLWIAITAFFCIQLQGTFYNYYYVIVRHFSAGGDRTSSIFETETPKAFPHESQRSVDVLFFLYTLSYSLFDKIVYALDRKASTVIRFPRWFMTLCSLYGLGFQLLVFALLLATGNIGIILPFFIAYSVFIPVLLIIRKVFLTEREAR
ncbi:MAG: CDP-alcohol phosphatidyltransferase family protein [Balneolia bacterium]|nr:CDP-alcohol phosphatidyltransferase family protein [Balneolia bacterium]